MRRLSGSGLWLLGTAFVLAACSACSSSSSKGGAATDGGMTTDAPATEGGGGGPTAARACSDWATAICANLEKCTPFAVTSAYPPANGMTAQQTCVQRTMLACTPSIAANGSKMTPALLEQCVQAVQAETCDQSLDNYQPSACSVAGTLAAGAACGSDWQCQSTYCEIAPGSTCGKCGTRAMAGPGPDGGVTCASDNDCAATLVCSPIFVGGQLTQACVAPAESGAACGVSQPCQRTLACLGLQTDGGGGSCGAPRAAGQSCASIYDCDIAHGIYCNLGTNKCAMAGTATMGQPCGIVSGGYVQCTQGTVCANVDSKTGQGTCHVPAADGDPCSFALPCEAPAVCVVGSKSVSCTLPDPASCH